MNCPKCGFPCKENETICPSCKTPISNAEYTPVEKKPSKKGKFLLILLLLLVLLAGGAYAGYQYYLKAVEKRCLENTERLMSSAQKMDFSQIDPAFLPDVLKEEPDLRAMVKDYIDTQLEEHNLNNLFSLLGMEVDYDAVIDLILANSDYSIDPTVDLNYKECTFKVSSSNLNYPSAIRQLEEKLNSLVNEQTSAMGWWNTLKDWVNNILSNGEGDLPTTLSGWIARLTEGADPEIYTGQITFGIQDKKWTILSVDENLFYNLYGFPKEAEE